MKAEGPGDTQHERRRPDKLSWRAINLVFLITTAIAFTGEGHVTAFTPLLLRDLGLVDAEVAVWTGLLFAITAAMALPLAPFLGVLAERYTRKRIILRTYFLMAAALLVSAWASSVAALVLGRMLMGLSFGSIGVIIAYQSLITPRSRLGLAIATVNVAVPVSASLGPPVGSLLIPAIGLRGLLLLDALLVAVAGLALLVLLEEPVAPSHSGSVLGRTRQVLAQTWTNPPIRWNFVSTFLLRGSTSVVDSYLPVRITQLAADPATAIGWVLGIYGALTTVGTWALGRFVDRVDDTRLYSQAMLLGTVLTAGLALSPWLWLLGVLAALRSIPVAFSNTLLFTHQARVLPREQQTAVFALAPVPRNAGGLLFPLLASVVAGLAPGAPLVLGALTNGVTFLAGLRMRQLTPKKGVPEPEAPASDGAGP